MQYSEDVIFFFDCSDPLPITNSSGWCVHACSVVGCLVITRATTLSEMGHEGTGQKVSRWGRGISWWRHAIDR